MLTLTMGEVLRGSPDVEPSLGAVMDSLRDPLASPHLPTNDGQVVEVVVVMLGGHFASLSQPYGQTICLSRSLETLPRW